MAAGPARLGEARARIDGPAKVCGVAEFPGDVRLSGLAYAAPVRSAIACGRLVRVGRDAALAEPGVLDVLIWAEAGHMMLATPAGDALSWAFGALMIEVHIHARTGEVRVSRHVAAFAAGRILNP